MFSGREAIHVEGLAGDRLVCPKHRIEKSPSGGWESNW
jgi:hypothetical protein